MKQNEQESFVDVKFFLGLLLLIYGVILSINGLYYLFENVFKIWKNIDLLYGVFLFVVGAIFYWKSSKPKKWTKAFAHAGIESIEKKMKYSLRDS